MLGGAHDAPGRDGGGQPTAAAGASPEDQLHEQAFVPRAVGATFVGPEDPHTAKAERLVDVDGARVVGSRIDRDAGGPRSRTL